MALAGNAHIERSSEVSASGTPAGGPGDGAAWNAVVLLGLMARWW
jgi:hypothetical protein